jgi:hypothetical protein
MQSTAIAEHKMPHAETAKDFYRISGRVVSSGARL